MTIFTRSRLGRYQADLLEDTRRRRLLGHEGQLQVVNDPIAYGFMPSRL